MNVERVFYQVLQFVVDYGVLIAAVSLFFLLLSLIVTVYVVGLLPKNYWVSNKKPRVDFRGGLIFLFLRNSAALLLALIGIALLVLPGQGILTLLVALLVGDFPQKTVWVRRLVRRPEIQKSLNFLRRCLGKEDFYF